MAAVSKKKKNGYRNYALKADRDSVKRWEGDSRGGLNVCIDKDLAWPERGGEERRRQTRMDRARADYIFSSQQQEQQEQQ